MEEKNTEKMGMDITRFIDALIRKAWLIGMIAVVSAVLVFVCTFLFVTPLYESSTMFYVNNCSTSLGHSSASVSSGDISASRSLVKSYITILKTRETLDEVIDHAGVDLSYDQIKKMITARAVDDTEFFRATVTGPDPAETKMIADAIAQVLPGRISGIMDGTSAKIVDSPEVPAGPCYPDYKQSIAVGLLTGLMMAAGCVIVQEWADLLIRREAQIVNCCHYPVLAYVPDVKDLARRDDASRKKSTPRRQDQDKKYQTEPLDCIISSEAVESFRLLATKLQFIFEDKTECRVIGISSALAAEGKSITAVNLAYSMAQQGKRVLVIDCDMRRSSLVSVLPIARTPGLSDYLAGQCSGDKLIQRCKVKEGERAFHIISCGNMPPNPIELLGSERMCKMLKQLDQLYDYIILDLPSVGEVGDALAVSRSLDGLVLVIRRNYCNRIALKTAIRQFEFVNTKIIGSVFNCASSAMAQYGQWYGRIYRRKYRDGYCPGNGCQKQSPDEKREFWLN